MIKKEHKNKKEASSLGPIAEAIDLKFPINSFVKPRRKRKMKKRESEIRLLREVAWWYFRHLCCFFCKKPFIEPKLARNLKFGHRSHKPFKFKLTVHHEDEDRNNNTDDNLKWGHSDCHKAHHIKKSNKTVKTWDITTRYKKRSMDGIHLTSIRAATKESALRKAGRRGIQITKNTKIEERKFGNTV